MSGGAGSGLAQDRKRHSGGWVSTGHVALHGGVGTHPLPILRRGQDSTPIPLMVVPRCPTANCTRIPISNPNSSPHKPRKTPASQGTRLPPTSRRPKPPPARPSTLTSHKIPLTRAHSPRAGGPTPAKPSQAKPRHAGPRRHVARLLCNAGREAQYRGRTCVGEERWHVWGWQVRCDAVHVPCWRGVDRQRPLSLISGRRGMRGGGGGGQTSAASAGRVRLVVGWRERHRRRRRHHQCTACTAMPLLRAHDTSPHHTPPNMCKARRSPRSRLQKARRRGGSGHRPASNVQGTAS